MYVLFLLSTTFKICPEEHVCKNVKWYTPLENHLAIPENVTHRYDPTVPPPKITESTYSHKNLDTFIVAKSRNNDQKMGTTTQISIN